MAVRSTAPLIYLGRVCRHHRCADRLVETRECLECVGPQRLRRMEERSERQARERRLHRVLHEMSDGGKTALELVHTTGLSMPQVQSLLDELASSGRAVFGREQFPRNGRWLWSLVP
jgi:predicted Rossmann fold nucleotide-binding protein DprA/Smf involved in DNA uptake